jgi:hypothetical protein
MDATSLSTAKKSMFGPWVVADRVRSIFSLNGSPIAKGQRPGACEALHGWIACSSKSPGRRREGRRGSLARSEGFLLCQRISRGRAPLSPLLFLCVDGSHLVEAIEVDLVIYV